MQFGRERPTTDEVAGPWKNLNGCDPTLDGSPKHWILGPKCVLGPYFRCGGANHFISVGMSSHSGVGVNTHMGMCIDEAGRDELSGGINGCGALGYFGLTFSDICNFTIRKNNIAWGVGLTGSGQDGRALDNGCPLFRGHGHIGGLGWIDQG